MNDIIAKKSDLKNIHVVAGTPSEMEQAQSDLVAWAKSKIEAKVYRSQGYKQWCD